MSDLLFTHQKRGKTMKTKKQAMLMLIAGALLLGGPALAGFDDQRREQENAAFQDARAAKNAAKEGTTVTIKDPKNSFGAEYNVGQFTSRAQGDNKANNQCSCSKGGTSSSGKTGGDMGYFVAMEPPPTIPDIRFQHRFLDLYPETVVY